MNIESRLTLDGLRGPGDAIFFFRAEDEWGEFSNFSEHSLTLPVPFMDDGPGRPTLGTYPTGEHRFQAMKARTMKDHIAVVNTATPLLSKQAGRSIDLRDGWGNSYGDLCYLVMLETVMAKARANESVMAALDQTGRRWLYEDSPTDDIWGVRHRNDYRGKNLLGLAWMEARAFLLGR